MWFCEYVNLHPLRSQVVLLTIMQTDESAAFAKKMPHPMHAKTRGWMVYLVPLIVFMDDVSANILKQWNKHYVIYMSNASMPCEMIEKELCICFVSSSPFASPMDLMRGFKESLM